MREGKVNILVEDCLQSVGDSHLTRSELLLFLSQLLSRVGASIYWGIDNPEATMPAALTEDIVDALHQENPTLGTTLMQAGCGLNREVNRIRYGQ